MRTDWQIIRDIGVALGGDFDYQNWTDVLAEIALSVPMYRGITSDRVGATGVQWPRDRVTGSGTESLYNSNDAPKFTCVPLPVVGETPVRG